jgi:pantoate--beta-alanine ligase
VWAAQHAVASGVRDATAIESAGRAVLDVDAVDYFAVVDALTLEPLPQVDRPARLLTTCRVGGVRLLDNVALGPELSWT